ncbi:hypothetical protein BO86DRAFT_5390 [Aspergillus japonicus CBS 114.51]|uniref:Uncharacterized protein n=1 Tax=Aspergillus japonicus CBS 114.51 TaxID=1448312 RepID=A0A8T8XIZ6_ASPJA|nr:hypothetical protein BO86DRAFT_5390 [Aspergillus japonicus CBS 114.51]RAH87539.1 hypothetical protein BO86DRAFT_5390 [Aspergillus japonicus CBS 114.51]
MPAVFIDLTADSELDGSNKVSFAGVFLPFKSVFSWGLPPLKDPPLFCVFPLLCCYVAISLYGLFLQQQITPGVPYAYLFSISFNISCISCVKVCAFVS